MPDPLVIRFEGGLASEQLLPLHEGGRTLEGLGLCFTRVAHYLLTSEVRRRAPYDGRLRIITKVPRSGSIEFDFVGLLAGPAPTTLIGQIGISVTAGLVLTAGIYLIKKITGSVAKPPEQLRALQDQRPGDIDALGSAIVSPVKRAHSLVNTGQRL